MKKMFFAAALVLAAISLNVNAQAPADAPYGVKSGVIVTSMDMMGNEMVTETYFDNYGLLTATVSEGGGFMMGGGEGKTRQITVDGVQYRVNDAEKTATKMPDFGGGMGFGGGRPQINWNKLTDQVMKDNGIKELGKETIAGKECTKYSMTMDMMGQSMEQIVWIYKGIQLQNSMSTDMGDFGQKCKKFEEKDVEASMFQLPKEYKVEEFQMPDMGGFGGF